MRILLENSFQLNGKEKELKYSTTQVCKDFHENLFSKGMQKLKDLLGGRSVSNTSAEF